jgi:uncharacterized protein (DUF58 family)
MAERLASEPSSTSTNSTNFASQAFALVIRWIRKPFRWIQSAKNAATPVSTRLTREGMQVMFLALFVMVGAVLRDVNLLIILAGTLLATLLIQWRVCAKTLYGLTTNRRLPRSMHARKPFDIELNISNPKRWLGTWLVLAQDRLVHVPSNTAIRTNSQGIGLLYPSIPPNCTRVQKYRCVVQRRGLYRFLGTELTTRFPMGLMRGILPPLGGGTFVVQPAIGRLLPGWQDLFEVHESAANHRRTRSMSDEGDFFGLRAYRHGDSPRWIHWRSSARRDELVVKQFQREDSRELVVLLDLFRGPSRSKEERESQQKSEDLAVEFVATVTQQIATSNIGLITVAIADSEPMLANRVQSRSQCTGLLDRLGVAYSGTQNEIVQALLMLEREHHRVENLLVVSTRPKVDLAELTRTDSSVVFWRSVTWLNAANGNLAKYFTPAE